MQKKNLYLIHDSHFPFHRKMCILLQVRCHCPPTKSNFYLVSSLETVIREPTLYKLLTFHNPNLISIFHSLSRLSKESVQVRGLCKLFITVSFYGEGLLTPRPTPKAGGPPLVFCPRLLIQYIRS
jgi:hypothetical protein